MVDEVQEPHEDGGSVVLHPHMARTADGSEGSRWAIVIAGMHRSGTSALARVLSLLGAELPRNLMEPAAADNALGFWESRLLTRAHEKLLRSLGVAWSDPDPIPPSWFRSPVAERYEYWLVDLLRQEYDDAPLFVVKDPRICRLIPLWQKTLTRLGVTSRFVIPIRNPLEVAASLKERNDLSTNQSLLLWLRHVLEAERDTRGSGRAFLSYEDLLRDWRSSLCQLSERLGVAWPQLGHEADARIESFLVPAQRHQRYDSAEVEARLDVVSWVKEAYRAALAEADGHDESHVFDAVRRELDAADIAFGSILAGSRLELRDRAARLASAAKEAETLQRKLSLLEDERSAGEAELAQLRAELADRNEQSSGLRRALDAAASELAALEAESERRLADGRAHLESRAAEIEELRQELARAKQAEQALAAAEVERHELNGQLVALGAALEERQRAASDAARELEARRGTFEAMERELAQVTLQLEAAQEDGEAWRRRSREAEARSRAELVRKAEELAAARAAADAVGADLERQAAKAKRIEAQLFSARERARRRAQESERRGARVDRLGRDLQGLRYRLAGMESERLQAARAQRESEERHAAEVGRLEDELKVAQFEAERAGRESSARHAAEIERLESELQAALGEAEKALTLGKKTLPSLRAELARATEEIESLKLHLSGARRETRELEDELAHLQSQLGTAHDAINHRDRVIHERATELSRRVDEAAAMAEDRAALEETLRATRKELVETQLAQVRIYRQLMPWILKPTLSNLRQLKTYQALKRSGEFDRRFYYTTYADVAGTRMDPLRHFVAHGWEEGRNPNSSFNTVGYLERRPDVAAARINPLLHYIRYGRTEEAAAIAAQAPAEPAKAAREPSPLASPAPGAVIEVREGTTAVVGTPPPELDDAIPFPALSDARDRPFGDTAATAHFEALRSQGLAHLLVPRGSVGWLSARAGFRRYLSVHYPKLAAAADGNLLYDARPHDGRPRSWRSALEDMLLDHQTRFRGGTTILDWNTGLPLGGLRDHINIATPPADGKRLPYLADSFDLVLALSGDADLTEARRVARNGVITMDVAGGPLRAEWLRDPELRRPTVSIVIPSYNGAGFLRSCLRGLHETLPRAYDVEVVVVDDESSDDTPAVLREWAALDDRFRSIRNKANSGFTITCNNGAQAADGEVIVFLNNDTVPIAGWLPPLVRSLLDRANTGAVGGKMVFPDGRLQEAGAVVFSDGRAANFGKNDPDPDAPLYNFLRDVDYCSAALLATPREFFLGCGGFDTRYAPIYYEDTDYCLQVHDAGLSVLYQPESVIVHAEGGWSGNDISKGGKRHQAVNQAKFVAKWAHVLRGQPAAPSRYDSSTWERLAVRTQVGKD